MTAEGLARTGVAPVGRPREERGVRTRSITGRAVLLAALTMAILGAGTATASTTPSRIQFSGRCNRAGTGRCGPEFFGIRYTVLLGDGGVAAVSGSFSKHHRGESGTAATPPSSSRTV